MASRPILFSGPMVRAIIAGRKTQTRRILNAHELAEIRPDADTDEPAIVTSVRFAPGDKLWVRETWGARDIRGCSAPRIADIDTVNDRVEYRADGVPDDGRHWFPSIHMPRWASRITLDVTGVRVERLQDITESDVFAEGVQLPLGGCEPECARKHPGQGHALVNVLTPHKPALDPKCSGRDYAVAEFAVLWEEINGKRAPWASNPWVWVVTFRRLP